MSALESSQFEGPEKLLEIWFAPSPADVERIAPPTEDGKYGLRKVDKAVWEEMLKIVGCKVLSVIKGSEIDAYLLSESSLFISPHRLILKTCGTTLNLYGLPRILEIARDHANLPIVHQFFYSRKSFMFPERQLGPHKEWKAEVGYLDAIFPHGAAYTVGKVNGDHWLLYMTKPQVTQGNSSRTINVSQSEGADWSDPSKGTDYTIEILMTHLSPTASELFFSPEFGGKKTPSTHAQALSYQTGISDLFPPHLTTLDAYSFTPCGYSSNALLKWSKPPSEDEHHKLLEGEGYYTIHVTPEGGWSYASFECNVSLPTLPTPEASSIPDLQTLVRRVVRIFQPAKLSLTLFISSVGNNNIEEEGGINAVEAAQRAFGLALTSPSKANRGREGDLVYRRTDKINYEFGSYDLAFASFELNS
ncbi:S-adenosylmethionine decarboxylase [Thelephora ganbajun]|uniref:S-adenosylmethionine decarboxylase n=1 Tax=Thelephora ganbajun TaxID=370292 RepID=A0ACB6ZB51_THEGA|nr:S-adenosylmethionine decarboxylase [Thelephora ganbajun]